MGWGWGVGGGRLYAPCEKDIKQIMTVCTHCVLSNVNFEVLSFLKIGFLASQLCVEYLHIPTTVFKSVLIYGFTKVLW